ncbi:protein-L-isoaspartate O-methyltransferase family protein [Novosphingobium album (ex Liu et al. 2023)]|uniref:Protein-L-isoaspartate O-methyltransferase n=1 Tax=Novosphingobium album (ex Liu et al. 2023) TaxID=3031130 RepID=A0ABT5WNZ4_9SPHN|nr:protein-L-isoaspartate O-methyltransferase [Novosphingobium album (ex Liu et al. 2023)]MDE8651753.1 protein-L-isoaspartate O-methyltransferase [Novosphingobium album (ex Liu et al. 2023)]
MTMTEDRPTASSEAARRAMIDSQLRTSGVNEPWVLAAMANVAREDFVPEAMRAAAYIDRAIPLGNGRSLAAPLVHGRMLAEAAPKPADKALLVGDGQGYLAALLRPLVGTLDAVDPAAATKPAASDGFSLIVIDGAIEELPAALAARLGEGGRVVTGLLLRGVTRLAVGRKTAGEVSLLPLAEIGIPVLPEFAAPKRWSF